MPVERQRQDGGSDPRPLARSVDTEFRHLKIQIRLLGESDEGESHGCVVTEEVGKTLPGLVLIAFEVTLRRLRIVAGKKFGQIGGIGAGERRFFLPGCQPKIHDAQSSRRTSSWLP